MVLLTYGLMFCLLLVSLIVAIARMSVALDEADLERFVIWTCIASVIACVPMTL